MNIKLLILFFLVTFNGYSQDSVKIIEKKILYIPTHGHFSKDEDSLNNDFQEGVLTAHEAKNLHIDSTTLIVLSLIDSDSSITNNWETFKKKYNYQPGNYLIVVANQDDGSKGDFVLYFYEQWSKGFDIKKSYEMTVNEFQRKYPTLKYYLNSTK